MEKSLVSIVIPVYNAEKYLSRCLDSVIAQNYKDFEVICIDDGSSDKSGILLDGYAGRDPRIKVFHKQNEGVSIARNIGIQMSRGEYILFLDSDDWYETNCLEQMMLYSDNDMVVCRFINYAKEKSIRGPEVSKKIKVKSDLYECWNEEYVSYWVFIWGKLFKSSIIKQNNILFDTMMRYLEDFCFVLKYMSHIETCFMTNEILMNHILEPTKYSKYIMDYEELDIHMQKSEDCFKLFEERCGKNGLIGMREGIAYRHFYNFLYYIRTAQVSFARKINEINKFKEYGHGGLYEYIKIQRKKLRYFWKILNYLAILNPKQQK